MTSLALRLARPEIIALEPFDIAGRNANATPDAIKLDANENPYPPLVEGALAASVNRYPEPQPQRLKALLAALYGVASENVVITRGADDAIDMLVRAFCRPATDAVAVCTPSFTAYAHFVKLQGARLLQVPLNGDFDFDAEAFIETVGGDANLKLAFICTPNNPTGNEVDPALILRVADALPETIVVADEAYLDFAQTPSLAGEATKRANLIVLKTLSKAYGLAGARVGCAIGEPEPIAVAARALPPYPMASPSVDAAVAALAPSRRAIHEERIARIKADRERIARLLTRSPIVRRVRPSGGNFLFLEVEDAEALAGRLRALGIRVRFRANAAPGGVRVTIGTETENEALLRGFGVEVETVPGRRSEVVRDTRETAIAVAVDLDSTAPRKIETGVPFYDHMLDQVAAHGGFSLLLSCDGDTEIDAHHSVEDCAIALGAALSKALGDKRGIRRFGFTLPMDEAEAQVLIDLSGRPFCRFEGEFAATHIGEYPTQMTAHVFRSFADSMGAAIHVKVEGENDHHKTEACFKAFGRALRDAIRCEGDVLPSTKGVL
ncbi:MAG TPA: histidinol-phosphate transaminase [Sphingomicrobium sp.]|nr:histidinol-phosphate transaminase [Sphingomicrobium sp.]